MSDARTALATVSALLGRVMEQAQHPEQTGDTALLLLDAYQAASAGLAPEPQATSAAEIEARWQQTTVFPVMSGFTVEARFLNPVTEILAGTLPNPVLRASMGWDMPAPTLREQEQEARKEVQRLLSIAARALVKPRLVLPEEGRPPALDRNEISPAALRLDDLREIERRVLLDPLPEVAGTLPFPVDAPAA